MSKLGGVGTLDDGVDTSVPGIEMSDINDGDILARTRENVNPNGLFQFVYIPDDGSENVTSDWIDQEHKKKVLRSWVDGVKNALIGRSQSKIQEAKDKALEERARRVRDEQFGDLPSETGRSSPAQQEIKPNIGRSLLERNPTTAGPPTDSPDDYIHTQLEIAKQRLIAAEGMQNEVIKEVIEARKSVAKWNALASALAGSEPISALQVDSGGSEHQRGNALTVERSGRKLITIKP